MKKPKRNPAKDLAKLREANRLIDQAKMMRAGIAGAMELFKKYDAMAEGYVKKAEKLIKQVEKTR